MTDWIRVRGRGSLTKTGSTGESPATPDEIGAFARQVAADAVYGSFGEFQSDYWKDKWSVAPKDLVQVDAGRDNEDHKTFTIEIRLNPILYNVKRGGLQHFLGVLAGDLFYLRIAGFNLKDLRVTEVQIPDAFNNALEAAFRKEAHSADLIRTAFELKPPDAFLAFSLKPRVGLKQDAIREIALGVLEAGFHLVEFDTRYLDLTDANLPFLLSLASEAAAVGGKKRITRLSLNLSVSEAFALDIFERFIKTSDWPLIVKIDGGFDGLSTIQAMRHQFTGRASPIITCYPLLRDQLASRIPPDLFVRVLSRSGVDIIYPGKGPSVGKPFRELGQDEIDAIGEATRRYRHLADQEWPIISLAGGVYAGQLHALYELVGPKVAYFLGGAVSLHRHGPIEGAKLCFKILTASAKHHRNVLADVPDLPGDLIEEIEAAYEIPPGSDKNTFHYVPPRDLNVEVPRL